MTLKEYLERVKNGEKLAIHTTTQADYDKLMKQLDKMKFTLILGTKPSYANVWRVYESKTCIRVSPFQYVYYDSKGFYKRIDFTVIPFADISFDNQ